MGIHLSNVHVGYNQGSINAIAHFKYPTSANIICRWATLLLAFTSLWPAGAGLLGVISESRSNVTRVEKVVLLWKA